MTALHQTQQVVSHIFRELGTNLKPVYTYHSLSHTTMVMRDATFLATKMQLSFDELKLLQTAICFHDYGFVVNHEEHEQRGCNFAQEVLPGYGYSADEIAIVCGMIMATKIPQSPYTLLERIICDADLFYLGTQYYFQVADLFKKELTGIGVLKSESQWKDIQVKFLENHSYHTDLAVELLEKDKQKNLLLLKSSN